MSQNRSRIDPAIIAAVIGVMGTLCVTLITLYVNYFGPWPQPTAVGQPTDPVQQPTWTIPPTVTITNTPAPTDTSAPGEPTSTPVPDTPTPAPTFTPVPPAIGADWANNCISVLWRPFPDMALPTAGNGCYAGQINFPVPVNTMYVQVSRLKFLGDSSLSGSQVFGLFAPIPASGIVRISTNLRRVQGGEIWMGVFAEPNLNSQGLVAVIPPGENVRKRELVQRKMPEQGELHRLETFAEDPTQDPPQYSIVFELSNGEVKIQKLRDTEFSPVALGSGQAYLFVGYQLLDGNNRIDAEFLNLLVQPQ